MKFGDQADNVQAQAEMWPAVIVPAAPAAGLPERLEQPPLRLRRDGRPGVVDFKHREVGFEREAQGDRRSGRAEVHRVVDELVEQLHDQVGSARRS